MRRVIFCFCGLIALVAAPSGVAGADRPQNVEVRPQRIDDVLTNPNVGFADFHMGWHVEDAGLTADECAERRGLKWPENYPATAVAYFRWFWNQLEPKPGEIDFEYIDRRMQAANRTGQTLAFRVIAIKENGAGIPDWLRQQVRGVEVEGTFWPDYRDPVFQQAHQRFVQALAKRYNGHPALDHLDIGPVGCWGEWNTACTQKGGSLIEIYGPKDDAARDAIAAGYKQVVADYADAFTETPLVMLALGSDGDPRMIDLMGYALKRGTGWRVDCWGDWELFSKNWSPSYTRRTLAYRLRNGDKTAEFTSAADVRKWLPGRWEMRETFRLPTSLPAGVYRLEVAILDRAGTDPRTEPLPPLQLGIAGRAADGWYPLSEVAVE